MDVIETLLGMVMVVIAAITGFSNPLWWGVAVPVGVLLIVKNPFILIGLLLGIDA